MSQPGFAAYAGALIVLSANLMFLWAWSGVVRGKTKTALNREDAATFGSTLVDSDPPAVARVLRAHQNAQASILPFLVLGLVYVLAGGNGTFATVVFAIFTIARLLHSVAYLKELQPWRTVSFLAGGLCILALMGGIAWLLLR